MRWYHGLHRFEQVISEFPTWNSTTQAEYQRTGIHPDCLLQDKQELLEFCLWIEAHQIRSYLEIGIWTGKLLQLLDRLFQFEKIGVCDLRSAEQLGHSIVVPEKAHCFWGDSHSIEFMAWRQEMGHFDLVFIDGDHSYTGVRQDFLINKRYSQDYLAFHDIGGRGPTKFWQELEGEKTEIFAPQGANAYAMGIGIWRSAQD